MNAKLIPVTSRRLITARAVLWATACVLAAPAAAVAGIDVCIDPDPLATVIQNETSLTVVPSGQPGQPALIAAAYNDDPVTSLGLGVSVSTDVGVNWSQQQLAIPTDATTGLPHSMAFDPSIVADMAGNLYAAHISSGAPGDQFEGSGLYVHSGDSLGNFTAPANVVSYDGPLIPANPAAYRFNDKCHITVDLDPNGQSSYPNRLYTTWIKDRGWNQPLPGADIYFAYSTDGAVTWNYPGGNPSPTIINDNPGTVTGMCNGPVAAVAPNGTIYVAWLNVDLSLAQDPNAALYIDRSFDGGVTWGPDIRVRGVQSCPKHLSSGTGVQTWDDTRARSYPAMAVAPQNSNVVYLVVAEDTFVGDCDEGDIYLLRSTDGGLTWPHRVRVNNDMTEVDQFEPWIDVKPDGTIDVAWYDRRNDPGDTLWDVYIARSTDWGMTFPVNVCITDKNFPAPFVAATGDPWIGEYLGLAVDSQFAYLAFTSTVSDANHGDVYFDIIANVDIPEPGMLALLGAAAIAALRRRRPRR